MDTKTAIQIMKDAGIDVTGNGKIHVDDIGRAVREIKKYESDNNEAYQDFLSNLNKMIDETNKVGLPLPTIRIYKPKSNSRGLEFEISYHISNPTNLGGELYVKTNEETKAKFIRPIFTKDEHKKLNKIFEDYLGSGISYTNSIGHFVAHVYPASEDSDLSKFPNVVKAVGNKYKHSKPIVKNGYTIFYYHALSRMLNFDELEITFYSPLD